MATILEALQNANYNIDNVKKVGLNLLDLVKNQLNNAVILLENGYDIHTDIESIVDKYGSVENAPPKDRIQD